MSDLISQNLNMIFKTPKGETVHALKDVNFTLKKGELLTVLGPSGCGKTTLLNITAGFIRPTSGKITLNNKEIDGPGVERGMVFQQGALFEWLTVAENVNFGLRMKNQDPVQTEKKVEEWLEKLLSSNIPASAVNSVESALSDEQTIANDMVVSVNHSEAGVLKMLGVPYRFSDTPATINKAPPLLGEDNREILQSIGYDNDQIDSLIKSEVI